MGWSTLRGLTKKGEGIKVGVGSPWPQCTGAGSPLLGDPYFTGVRQPVSAIILIPALLLKVILKKNV